VTYPSTGLLIAPVITQKNLTNLLHCVQPDCQTTAQVTKQYRIASENSTTAGLESRLNGKYQNHIFVNSKSATFEIFSGIPDILKPTPQTEAQILLC
jgi:hypothetical protein